MRKTHFLILFTLAMLMLPSCAGKKGTVCASQDRRAPRNLNEYLENGMSVHDSLDMEISEFMKKWHLKGASLSVMRNDSLLYSKGYGWADLENGVCMTPGTILRVASVSKLITATGIMILSERGLLSLNDHVFGEDGILSEFNPYIKDKRIFKITVNDLLRHEGGFTSRNYGDPLFSSLRVQSRYKLDTNPDTDTLIGLLLGERLRFFPGTSQEYSNLGYLLLSRIIEKKTGSPYEEWMQENVLVPAGCHNMRIAENLRSRKHKGESCYYMQSYDRKVKEYNGSGRDVERCYGGNDIHALSGAGAWVTSSAELMRFVASIDGKPSVPDIISKESVKEMTIWFDNGTYSLGWNDTNPKTGWQRTGSFSGTSAIIKYFPDGECWIFISNTSTYLGSKFTGFTSSLLKRTKAAFSGQLPSRDMFYE